MELAESGKKQFIGRLLRIFYTIKEIVEQKTVEREKVPLGLWNNENQRLSCLILVSVWASFTCSHSEPAFPL